MSGIVQTDRGTLKLLPHGEHNTFFALLLESNGVYVRKCSSKSNYSNIYGKTDNLEQPS